MTPLQQAAKAARDKGLALPMCPACSGAGEVREWICGETERYTCDHCAGCGVDTSDPYALLGRAMCALEQHTVGVRFGYGILSCHCECSWQEYDGTPEGIATAALRLWVRCAA